MKKILLTGFGPFSDFSVNPSEVLVRDLEAALADGNSYIVASLIFSVDYKEAAKLVESIEVAKYDYIFQFGVASNRTKISLERVALNWIESNIADNSGTNFQPRKIDGAGAEAYFCSLDLSRIVQKINEEFKNKVEVSLTAGGYLCNYVYYKTRQRADNVLFVHIPVSLEGQPEYQENLRRIAVRIIETVTTQGL